MQSNILFRNVTCHGNPHTNICINSTRRIESRAHFVLCDTHSHFQNGKIGLFEDLSDMLPFFFHLQHPSNIIMISTLHLMYKLRYTLTELEKGTDSADMSVLFFSGAVLIFRECLRKNCLICINPAYMYLDEIGTRVCQFCANWVLKTYFFTSVVVNFMFSCNLWDMLLIYICYYLLMFQCYSSGWKNTSVLFLLLFPCL